MAYYQEDIAEARRYGTTYEAAIDSSVLIDMIILLSCTRDDETLNLLDKLIETYGLTISSNARTNHSLVIRYLDLLKKLRACPRKEDGDAARSSCIAEFLVKNGDVREEEPGFFDALAVIADTIKETVVDKELIDLKKQSVRFAIAYFLFKQCNQKMSGKLTAFRNKTCGDDQEQALMSVVSLARQIVDLSKENSQLFQTAAEESVDFNSNDSLSDALVRAIESEKPTGVLKTDLRGLNKMLGKRGGFTRGEFVVIYGLSHHFKSGLLTTIARGIASQNDGLDFCKPGKKPLLLFISHENKAALNTLWFYKTAYMYTFREQPSFDTPVEDMLKVMKDFYMKNHWEFIIEMYQGSKFSFDDYTRTIESYEAQGYEVVVVFHDYLEKMKKKCSIYDGSLESSEALKATCQAMFDWNKSRNITYITPHQFNRTMQQVADRVRTNVVRHFSADGVSGSIAINQIADLEIYVYKEIDLEKEAWLTVQRGKHRYVEDTNETDQYFAYKFTTLGILPDVNDKKGKYVRDIYAQGPESKSRQTEKDVADAYAKAGEKDKQEPTEQKQSTEQKQEPIEQKQVVSNEELDL